jgi:SAM-dependent methyltransferase
MTVAKKNRLQMLLSRIKNERSVRPVSRIFGLDRGQAIDRYYIEKFLYEHRSLIKGVVLEVAGSAYTRKFGGDKVKRALILQTAKEDHVDIVGNLETGEGIPENAVDCFILTQTLLCIFDLQAAARNATQILKPGGALLLTVPGITPISRFDYERWGQYWSFTDQAVRKLFETLVPPDHISVQTFGNVKIAAAFLYGLARAEVKQKDLDTHDPDFQVVIAAVVKKPNG